jgi:hypothetical protein
VAALLLFSGPFWAVSTIAFQYFQAASADRGLSNGAVGLILGAGTVLGAAGAASAARLARVGSFGQQVVLLATLTGVALAGIAAGPLALALAAYGVANLANGVVEPVLLGWFNQNLPAAQRATLLSVEAWLVSMTIIVAFPAAGWLASGNGWGALYVVCGGVKLALGLALLVVAWRRR